jgi:hypothetical protein
VRIVARTLTSTRFATRTTVKTLSEKALLFFASASFSFFSWVYRLVATSLGGFRDSLREFFILYSLFLFVLATSCDYGQDQS